MEKTFTTMEKNIDELEDKESDLISSESEDSSGNSHLQFHNKTTSFTGTNKFNTDREHYVKISGVKTPSGVVLHQSFEESNRKVLFKKSHENYTNIDHRNIILLGS